MSSPIVLVVYQDEAYLRRVREALNAAGYEVHPVASAADALSEVQRCQPRVVVLCPCIGPQLRREITRSVHKLHPKLTVLHLDSNHVDDVSEWPIQ